MKTLVVTGFLGAGKTTLINRLLPEMLLCGRVAVIENEFGAVGIDTPLLAKAGVEVRELLSGCICCTLQGEMVAAIRLLTEQQAPDWLVIEPSGISRTSDLLQALKLAGIAAGDVKILNLIDCDNFADYIDSFGSFFTDQVAAAGLHVFSHLGSAAGGTVGAITLALRRIAQRVVPVALLSDAANLWPLVEEMESLNGWVENIHSETGFPLPLEAYTIKEPAPKSEADAADALTHALECAETKLLRLKGFLAHPDGGMLHIEYKTGMTKIAVIREPVDSGLVVIGQNLDHHRLCEIFANTADGREMHAQR